jgi:DNA-directed RNA polymerase subunit M/transcription elongation factor TFIIS
MAHQPTCPTCTSADLLVVVLSPKGTPMRFTTCRHCENRWWEDVTEGASLDLGAVIEHIHV